MKNIINQIKENKTSILFVVSPKIIQDTILYDDLIVAILESNFTISYCNI